MKYRTKNLLAEGLKQLGFGGVPNLAARLLAYVALMEKWNKAYNLTAIRDTEKIITHHILDSLAIAPYISGQRILDVGAGAGLPGIPLAMVFPEKHFTPLDSNGKKTRFLTHAVAELELQNVEVVQARVEGYHPDACFDCVVARAFSSLADLLEKTQHLRCENGRILAMKGRYPTEEIAATQGHCEVHTIDVPFLNEARHVVLVPNNVAN